MSKVNHVGFHLEDGRKVGMGICDNGDVSIIVKRPLLENDEPSAISEIVDDERVTQVRLTDETFLALIDLYAVHKGVQDE